MRDLRDAIRALRAAPIVSGVAILSLALGIGANAAIFSIVNGLLLRALPVHEPERLMVVQRSTTEFTAWTYPIWEQVRQRKAPFDGAAAYSTQRFNVARSGQSDLVEGLYVSGEFFDLLGVPAMLGRVVSPSDDRRGGGDGPVAVISYAYWQSRYGGAADAIGTTLTLERVPFTIVGVTPPSFFGPTIGRTFDVAVPFGTEPLLRGRSGLDERSMWWLDMVVRLQPGQTVDAATTALRGVQSQIREATLPTNWRPQDLAEYLKTPFVLIPAGASTSPIRNRFATPMLALMAVASFVLLIACANIANLLLARSTARRHEMAVRTALGASKLRLARQLITESLLLASAGAGLGVLFARWAAPLLIGQMTTPNLRLYLDLSTDWRLVAFTAAAATATALLFGTAPAFRATRVHASDALKEQSRGQIGEARFGLGNVLIVAQIALSLMLIVAAGLFVGTFVRLATLNPGFDQERVLVTSINAQRSAVPPAERLPLYERLRTAAAAIPGVGSAAASVVSPVGGMTLVFRVNVPGGAELNERERGVHVNVVSPDFFKTYGTRLLAGREFTPGDGPDSAPVAIVNAAFARKFVNGANPIGRIVVQEGSPKQPAIAREIVGYAENAIYRNLRQDVPPTLYIPLQAATTDPFVWGGVQLSVRSATGSPALLTRAVSDTLTAADPDLALTFRPLAEQVRNSLAQERVVAILSGFFGGLALLLASLGLYGVTAYTVGRRKSEIGIRMALGAESGTVLRMVLGRVAVLVLAGVLVGTAASLWAARFVTTLLFGLEPRDPATLAGGAIVLAIIGGFAGWLPARRAARIDPAQVLREV